MKKLIKKMEEAEVIKVKELKAKLESRIGELEKKKKSLSNSISKNFDFEDAEDSDMQKLTKIIKADEIYEKNKVSQSREHYKVENVFDSGYVINGGVLNITLFGLKYNKINTKSEDLSEFQRELITICYFYSAIKELEDINSDLKDFINEQKEKQETSA